MLETVYVWYRNHVDISFLKGTANCICVANVIRISINFSVDELWIYYLYYLAFSMNVPYSM